MGIDELKFGINIKRCSECINNDRSKWIDASVLPPDDGDVLVYFEYFRYGSFNRLFRNIGISHTFNGEWSGFVNGSSGWEKLKIIAWQPLPEKPED
jgi:hypothetical protein